MVITLFFILITLFLLTRCTLAASTPNSFDSYGHLSFIKSIKSQKTGVTGSIVTNVVASKPFKHPFLFHWLLAFLPWNFLSKRSKWINPSIELIFIGLVICILSLKMPLEMALKLGICYVLTPSMFTSLSSGPRVSSFTPRIISEFTLNIFFLVYALFDHRFDFIFICSIICIVITLLSSKFGLQVALFMAINLCLLGQTLYPIYVFLSAIFLSLLFFGPSTLYIWKEQIIHLVWYFRQNLRGKMSVSRRNSISKIVQAFKKHSGWKGLMSGVYHLLVKNSYTSTLIKSPLIIVSVCSISFSSAANDTIHIVLLAVTVIYILTNLRWFLFLGEAERYLNHTIILFYVYLVNKFPDIYSDRSMFIIISYGLMFFLIELFYLKRMGRKAIEIENESKSIIQILNKEVIELNILCSPFHAVGVWRILVETIHRPFFIYTCKEQFKKDWAEKYKSNYPAFNFESLDVLTEDYPVNVIILDQKNGTSIDEVCHKLSVKGYTNVIPNLKHFKLFKKYGD